MNPLINPGPPVMLSQLFVCLSSYAWDLNFQWFEWQLKHAKNNDHLLRNMLGEKYKVKMYYGITFSKCNVTLIRPPQPPVVTARTSQHADTILSPLSVLLLNHVFVETVSGHRVSTSGLPSNMIRSSRQRNELGAKVHGESHSWPCCVVQRRHILIVLPSHVLSFK